MAVKTGKFKVIKDDFPKTSAKKVPQNDDPPNLKPNFKMLKGRHTPLPRRKHEPVFAGLVVNKMGVNIDIVAECNSAMRPHILDDKNLAGPASSKKDFPVSPIILTICRPSILFM